MSITIKNFAEWCADKYVNSGQWKQSNHKESVRAAVTYNVSTIVRNSALIAAIGTVAFGIIFGMPLLACLAVAGLCYFVCDSSQHEWNQYWIAADQEVLAHEANAQKLGAEREYHPEGLFDSLGIPQEGNWRSSLRGWKPVGSRVGNFNLWLNWIPLPAPGDVVGSNKKVVSVDNAKSAVPSAMSSVGQPIDQQKYIKYKTVTRSSLQ